MAFKFFHIGKANEEVTRLEGLVQDRDEALKSAQEKISNLESAAAIPSVEYEKAKSTSQALSSEVARLQSEIARLQSDLKAAQSAAPAKAAEIVAAQSVPPVVNVPTAQPSAATKTSPKQLRGLDRFIAATRACFEQQAVNAATK